MLAHGDSHGIQGFPAASAGPFPGWARAVHPPETEAEAAFLAGAALARLDAIVRENPPWAGVFRQRLALSAAAASVARAGRAENEAALRDAFHLRRGGGAPGPAGKVLLAWRELAARPTRQWRSSLVAAAEVLGIAPDEAMQEALEVAAAGVESARPAPFAAARVFALASGLTSGGRPSLRGRGGEGEALAAWLADAVLAERLNWPFALPMLAAQLRSPGARAGDMRSRRRRQDDPRRCSLTPKRRRRPAISRLNLADARKNCCRRPRNCAPRERGRRCGRCSTTTCSAPRRQPAGISERGARRLFDRLVALNSVRELTGRATFRLYGL